MGLLYCPVFKATDANNVPVAGARLYTFDSVATTTPKATYSDQALTISNGAYVTADSSGLFPTVFGPESEIYYMELRTPGGAIIDQLPFVTMMGAEGLAPFAKDFGLDGRFQIRGSGGMPHMEFGDPAGDDVGGVARIGGWNNTQGTSLNIDFASLTVGGSTLVATDEAVAFAIAL